MSVVHIDCAIGDIWRQLALPDRTLLNLSDSSGTMPETAKRNTAHIANATVDYVHSPAHSLPFVESAVDRVLAQNILYHVQDMDAMLAEAARILRPDGLLCGIAPSENTMSELFELCARNGIPESALPRQFSLETCMRSLSRHFSSIEISGHISITEVNQAQSLIDQIKTMIIKSDISDSVLSAVTEDAQKIIAERGRFRTSKSFTAYSCRK